MQLPSRYFNRVMLRRKRLARRQTETVEAPVNTELPVITGTLVPGETLTVSDGTWLNDPTSFAYQWYLDDVEIDGETANTYTAQVGDGSGVITAAVTASNAGGEATATSAGVTIIENTAPPTALPDPPVIGTAMQYTPGTWSSGTPEFARWESSADGSVWATAAAMPDADSPPTDAEFGLPLRVVETNGGVTAESAATGAVDVARLWRDDYTAAVAAPMAGTRTNTPGPGTTTVVDADNELTVHATNKLAFAGTSPVFGDPKIHTPTAYARQAGRAAFLKIYLPTQAVRDNSQFSFGWHTAVTFAGTERHSLVNVSRAGGMNAENFVGGKHIPWAFDTDYVLGVVQRANGAHYVVRGGAYGDWARAFVTRTSTATPLYAGRQFGASGGQPDRTKAFYGSDLGGVWATDTDYNHLDATPTANDTATGAADGLQYITWACATGETLEISFRRTDDNNRMVLRCSESGDTMKIIKVEGGAETELSSAAQTFNNGTTYRIGLRYAAGEVRSWAKVGETAAENAPKNDITGATYNLAVTGVKVAGFASGSNWEVWPYWITGAANTQLDMHAPAL